MTQRFEIVPELVQLSELQDGETFMFVQRRNESCPGCFRVRPIPAEPESEAKAWYFTHVKGFVGDTAYLRIEGETSTVVCSSGTKPSYYGLSDALEYVRDGKWKEISPEDAAALVAPQPPVTSEPVAEPEPKVRYYRDPQWWDLAFVALADGEDLARPMLRDRTLYSFSLSRAELEEHVKGGSMVVLSEADALLDPPQDSEPSEVEKLRAENEKLSADNRQYDETNAVQAATIGAQQEENARLLKENEELKRGLEAAMTLNGAEEVVALNGELQKTCRDLQQHIVGMRAQLVMVARTVADIVNESLEATAESQHEANN